MTIEDLNRRELGEQASDWAFWPTPGTTLPDEAVSLCDCGHCRLGPVFNSKCLGAMQAWQWRAHQLHDELWRLRRRLNGEPEPDLGCTIDSRCACGPQSDYSPVVFHRRGSGLCRAVP